MAAKLMHIVKFEKIVCNKHVTWYTSQTYFKIYDDQHRKHQNQSMRIHTHIVTK